MKSIFRNLSKKDSAKRTSVSAPAAAHTRRPNGAPSTPFAEPPPAYTEITSAVPQSFAATAPVVDNDTSQAGNLDDRYSFLRTFDTIFLIDDSGSMAGGRWRQAAEALANITPICTSYDSDGVDIHFLNAPSSTAYNNVTSAESVHTIFKTVKPGGSTPTGQRLRAILMPYLRKYEADPRTTKPINLICITDGDSQDCVESVIIEAAKKLDALEAPAWQVGIQFFQIGNDPAATELLKYLDDELVSVAGGQLRDIVDTVPYKSGDGGVLTADVLLKVVLGSVNRRLDRRKV